MKNRLTQIIPSTCSFMRRLLAPHSTTSRDLRRTIPLTGVLVAEDFSDLVVDPYGLPRTRRTPQAGRLKTQPAAVSPHLSLGTASCSSPFHWRCRSNLARLHLRRDGDPLHHASTGATRIDSALYLARCHNLKFTSAIAGFTLPPLPLLKSHENRPFAGDSPLRGVR